jgi:protein phosphatase
MRKKNPDQQKNTYWLNVSLLSDVGCVRDLNEDSVNLLKPHDPEELRDKGILAVVADGMGGHAAGEIASRIAVETISRRYYEINASTQEALEQAFQEANARVFETSRQRGDMKGMGTTCTALVLKGEQAYCAHVGDSRIYIIRNGSIQQLSEDHSMVMQLFKQGLIDSDEARNHPDKNVLSRALGTHPQLEVSSWDNAVRVQVGDRFILCSDGLYDVVTDDEIQEIASAFEPHVANEKLIKLARQRGGPDNISVGLLSLEPSGVETAASLRATADREAWQ